MSQDSIKENKIKIACPTGIHIGTLDRPLLKLMKQTGFYRLCFGIETGNIERQKLIKKNINLEKAKQVIRDANDLGYWTSATFIFDFPKETDQQVKDTMNFIKESQLDFRFFIILSLNQRPKYMRNVSALYKEFIEWKVKNVSSYVNFIKKIRSFEDLRYATGLLWFGLTKIIIKPKVDNETVRGR